MIRSGLVFRMREIAVVVIMASPRPMIAWTPAMAGNVISNGEVPEIANSMAAAEAPMTMEHHEEIPKAMKNPFRLFRKRA